MRLKSKGERGRGANDLMVMACMWPRDRYYMEGPHVASNGRNTQPDQDEILSYIAQNGPCSRYDVELECMQSKSAVLTHLAALQKAGSITRHRDSYQVVG